MLIFLAEGSGMHPVIKIVSLLILSVLSTQGGWDSVLLTITIIIPFYFKYPELWVPALKMTFRLKWLFLSIIFIYFISIPEMSYLLLGVFRVLVLISIIFSVNLFLKTSTIEQILAALLWIFHPLNYININVERLSLRAVLTLEYVEILSQYLEKYKYNKAMRKMDRQKDMAELTGAPASTSTKLMPCGCNMLMSFLRQRKKSFIGFIENLTVIFQDVFNEVLSVKGSANKQYTINCLDTPRGFQLLIPPALCLLYIYNPLTLFIIND